MSTELEMVGIPQVVQSIWRNGSCLRILIELSRVAVRFLPIILKHPGYHWSFVMAVERHMFHPSKSQTTAQVATKLASFLLTPGKIRT